MGAAPASSAAPTMVAPADAYNGFLNLIESEVVSAADAMPADKYNFAPSKASFAPGMTTEFDGVRTFGAQVAHLAMANYSFTEGWGAKPAIDPKTISAMTSKADLVKALKDSFANLHASIAMITPENAFVSLGKGFGHMQPTRATMASFAIAHDLDHYGQMVVYLRMNGIVPPASRKKSD
jgi:hypothetical protein